VLPGSPIVIVSPRGTYAEAAGNKKGKLTCCAPAEDGDQLHLVETSFFRGGYYLCAHSGNELADCCKILVMPQLYYKENERNRLPPVILGGGGGGGGLEPKGVKSEPSKKGQRNTASIVRARNETPSNYHPSTGSQCSSFVVAVNSSFVCCSS
jgi:hypothetical protein